MIKEQTLIKKDTSENWSKAKNFIPKENEIIIYTDINKKKIGNGKSKLNELSFIDLDFFSVDGTTLIINSEKIEKEN
jgi:hypothetical protein